MKPRGSKTIPAAINHFNPLSVLYVRVAIPRVGSVTRYGIRRDAIRQDVSTSRATRSLSFDDCADCLLCVATDVPNWSGKIVNVGSDTTALGCLSKKAQGIKS